MVKIQTCKEKKEDSYIVVLHAHVEVSNNYREWLSAFLSKAGVQNTLAGITHAYNPRFLHGFAGANSPYII